MFQSHWRYLSKEDFKRYKALSTKRGLDHIFHSSLVLPILIYAITQMVESTDEFTELKWFQVLSDRKQNDPEVSNITWNSSNAVLIAQKILGNPFDRTLGAMVNIVEMSSGQR